MIYSNKKLLIIGQGVAEKYPGIAAEIINSMPKRDIKQMPAHLQAYCEMITTDLQSIKGSLYKSTLTEIRKVFISAMLRIYPGQHLLNKTISDIFAIKRANTSKIIKEVTVRYSTDQAFTKKVDQLLNLIQ